MQFRTQIDIPKSSLPELCHDKGILMLGSCFTDNIGEQLMRDGFDVIHNPMGPLYNPASILNVVKYAVDKKTFGEEDFVQASDGSWHCLDFASRYQAKSFADLAETINKDFAKVIDSIYHAMSLIITLGTAYVYERKDIGAIVGNCHKIPPTFFNRRLLTLQECQFCLQTMLEILPDNIHNVVFTVSPIRHIADGLHQNQISKATLLLSVNSLQDSRTHYFPSYEIMLDDLRDYRFYSADMKHPSDVAVAYIYEHFQNACFSEITKQQALNCRKQWMRANHRPILNDLK